LSILIFHQVLAAADPLFPDLLDASRFDQILRWLKHWFNVLPLDVAVRCLAEGALPARAVSITFDDGYADNVTIALPLLIRHNVKATFFIATGFLDGGCMWNDIVINALRHHRGETLDLTHLDLGTHPTAQPADRRKAVETLIGRLKYLPSSDREALAQRVGAAAGVTPPTNLMMTRQNVRSLRRSGMQIGGHTVSHAILMRVSLDNARREMADGKAQLEGILDEPVTLFAYPNGKFGVDYGEEHAALARALGFVAAVSTDWGAAKVGSDPMHLPRFTPWDRSLVPFALRLATNLMRKERAQSSLSRIGTSGRG
jgi:peptidoglycan/xylan/chitin deacetylase (PgdA/CDA1 family)